VSPPLPVELNRDRRHEIRVAGQYETDGPFDVDLRNHGDGVHVHVNVAGGLAEVARVVETNPYVDADEATSVRVDVDPVDEPVTGTLTLVTGYGGEETGVEVTVSPFEGPDSVPVGEDLSTPTADAERADPERAVERDADGGLPGQVLAVAGGAVLLAVAVAVLVGDRVVTVGAGVVVLAAVVAVLVAVR
jgi:hypothetical protein